MPAGSDELEAELTDEERDLLDRLAEGIVSRHMTPVAVFFLESLKPLGYVSSQLMLFLRPMVQTVFPQPLTYDLVARILERRGSIELLLRRIEERA